MFKYLLPLLLLLVAQAGTRGKIQGSLIDKESRAPVVSAAVVVEGTTYGAYSDFEGKFTVSQIPEGRYTILVDALHYEALRIEDVHIIADSVCSLGTLELQSCEVELELLSARADRKKVDLTRSSLKVSGTELLSSVPGFQLNDDGAVAARGSRPEEVKFVLNGIEVRDPLVGGQHFVNLDASNVVQVQPPHPPMVPPGETYDQPQESDWQSVLLQPVSTLSADVDAASYTTIRRMLNDGHLPPADAVRIEECLNFFRYDLPQPEGEHPLAAHCEVARCPWEPEHLLLQVGLQAKELPKKKRPPCNLVFLLDVSGSMSSPDKLALLQQAFPVLVEGLGRKDRVAIVVYAGSTGLVLESTSGRHKQRILQALARLRAGGSTAGGAGLQLAYSVAREHFISGGSNRVILATDGDFNVGIRDADTLLETIEEERRKGVQLTVIGVGRGNLQDDRLQQLASKGDGQHYYLDNLREARRVFRHELGGTLHTVARDLKLQLQFNPAHIAGYRLIGYDNRRLAEQDFADDRKDAAEVGAGHSLVVLYELRPATEQTRAEPEGANTRRYLRTTMDPRASQMEWLTLSMRYKEGPGEASRLVEEPYTPMKVPEIGQASGNMRWASAVAAFGLSLRRSEYAGSASPAMARRLGQGALGEDPRAERAEFLVLAARAEELQREARER